MNNVERDMIVNGREVLTAGLNLPELDLHGGQGFWQEVRRFCDAGASRLDGAVDRLIAGRSAPRVWAIMESPGSGQTAAAAALGFAQILADRGQSVVLVDADEQEQRITRWSGRAEQEGWIDMVRFGASLHASSSPLPSDNRRGAVVGIGSFNPTGATPDEIAELLDRLRHQADDLLLVMPAKLRSMPWIESAQIRVLCWDLLSRSQSDTEKIVEEMERMGAGPDVLLGFGMEEYLAIHHTLRESAPVGVEPEAIPQEEPADTESSLQPADEPESVPEPRVDEEIPVVGPPATDPESDQPETTRRRSSWVFVFGAVVAVACLGVLAVFFSDHFDRGSNETRPVAVARMDSETAKPVDLPVDGGLSIDPIVTEPLTDASGREGDERSSGELEAAEVPVTEPLVVEPPLAEPPVAQPDRVAFERTPFQSTVGTDGWALWLYSQPSRAEAEAEIRELQRRGIVATYREVEIKDLGRWYRVYAGDFETEAAAKTAVPGLLEQLKHDWAVPTEF